jgi:hypothetical protein
MAAHDHVVRGEPEPAGLALECGRVLDRARIGQARQPRQPIAYQTVAAVETDGQRLVEQDLLVGARRARGVLHARRHPCRCGEDEPAQHDEMQGRMPRDGVPAPHRFSVPVRRLRPLIVQRRETTGW